MTTWIELSESAFLHNINVIRQVSDEVPIWAVVKSNAYGYDLGITSEILASYVHGWMVTNSRDAEWLSRQGYNRPILVVLPVELDLFPLASGLGWYLGVTSLDYFKQIETFVIETGKRLRVHLEIETGMHRTGISPEDALEIAIRIQKQNIPIKINGLFTHLYDPANDQASLRQIELIKELQFNLAQHDISISQTHVFASDGLARFGSHYQFDAIRVGKALYGFCHHFPMTRNPLSWKTLIVAMGHVNPGETVGYNGTYTAHHTIKTATLPVGYADGLDRRLSNKGYVLVEGKLCPIIGRISMNETQIDITGVFKVEEGQEVVLLGKQGEREITLANIVEWGGVNDYEFITGINPLIKHIKVD